MTTGISPAGRRGSARAGSRARSRASSKPPWSEKEKRELARKLRKLEKRRGGSLRSTDLETLAVRGRSGAAIKAQAARMGLYKPRRKTLRWTDKEAHMLVILGGKRGLGARGIKRRGFFRDPGAAPARDGASRSAASDGAAAGRSLDSIAQKKRREGLVDPLRSLRAKLAHKLDREEQRRLRRELTDNPRRLSTEEIAIKFGVAPSTIRAFRKRWGIPFSWHDALALPASRRKRAALSERTRQRNVVIWRTRKRKLLERFEKTRDRMATRAGGAGAIAWRVCAACGRSWPHHATFFAPSPKRRPGKRTIRYLRRTCRVCPRRSRG